MESNQPQQSGNVVEQFENLKVGIRDVTHEINNPLGIIRMALYFLQTTNPEGEKREHYFKVMEDGLERIEQALQRLKMLRENSSAWIQEQPPKDQH